MSIFDLLSRFSEGVERTSTTALVSADQKRRWLKTALARITEKRPREYQRATVDIIADSQSVELPRDYYGVHEEDALLAVEYGYSETYAAGDAGNAGITSGYSNRFGSRIFASLTPVGSAQIAPIPAPEVRNSLIKGVSRKILQLRLIPTADREETLIYKAFWTVTDHRWEILIDAAPTNNLVTTVAGTALTWKTSGATGAQQNIGTTLNASAQNLSASINANITTLKAIAEGQYVIVRGRTADLDFTVTADGTLITATEYSAENTLDSDIEERVFDWMSGEKFDYIATDPAFNKIIDTETRKLYLQKSAAFKKAALKSLGIVTA